MQDIQKIMVAIRNLRRQGRVVDCECQMLYIMASYIAEGEKDIDKSMQELAEDSGYDVEIVRNIVGTLVELGHIIIIGDRAGHYIYDLNLPEVQQ